MSAAPLIESAEQATDDVLLRLQEASAWLVSLIDDRDRAEPVPDAARIDRLASIERLQASLEAAKCVEIVAFARSRAIKQVGLGVHPRRAEQGIAEEIGLAGRVSPSEGSRRLHTARDLVLDMPQTFDLLARGQINAGTVRRITEQLSHLDRATRTQVDAVLVTKRLDQKSPKEAAAAAQRAAYAADPVGSAARANKARKDRRVTLRPAPDTMSLLTGLLPVEQGVACLAALQDAVRQAKAEGDERTKGQIMADTLVARITGQESADDTGFEVGIVLPLGSLIDPEDPTPAEIPGHGPLPPGLARELIENATARSWWRRLFTRPTRSGGQLIVDLDQRRRRFMGWLAELIRWRDWTCRDAYCDAAIRHLDHIPPPHGRRRHRPRQRPGCMRTRQLHPRTARLERPSPRPRRPHRDHHHTDRPPVCVESTRAAVTSPSTRTCSAGSSRTGAVRRNALP